MADVKLCECGCGNPAPIATRNDRSTNRIKGQPMRFINRHSQRGVSLPAETRAKISTTLTGKKHSAERRAKNRAAHLGKKVSAETRALHMRHGMCGTPESNACIQAKARCTNPKDASWKDYGGRGIQFRFASFEEFFAELGPRTSPAHSLDRINNDGHYEIGNVRWATKQEQRANQRPYRKAA